MDYSKNISERIGKLRKQSGLTQEQLALRLGVTYQAVSKWENGQSCPDISLLPRLSDVFRVSLDDLFGRSLRNADLRKGLIAEYLFQGDAKDSSGQERHGTVIGAALCEDRFGRPNNAYSFDGQDDYIVVEKAPLLNEEGFSLSVWCNFGSGTRFEGWHSAIVSQDGHHARRVFQLSTLEASITFHRFMSYPEPYAEGPIHRNYWYHLAVTYDGSQYRMYRNGLLVSEERGRLKPDGEEPLYIGRKSTDEPYFFFQGKIDDIRIYDRPLTPDEVSELFLENGWEPAETPDLPEDEREGGRVLEYLEDVQMIVARKVIHEAAAWYIDNFGFKKHAGGPDENFYILSLYKGPDLVMSGGDDDADHGWRVSPVFYRTKLDLEKLRHRLEAAGGKAGPVRDEGFAYFLDLMDPFGNNLILIKHKR
ncbi:LamG-like jellyroll fold domain-containing protein [Paenibacillus harenae]|uniref:Transcriptional regulator with XRE-family HTH domain n=1 Tax=Paenibacillus harenae TaxID=306543 RepID=A0ABT9U0N7_PAEHA|nr:LamG-like jellyroll fold domain-containing protein [Paenibacillus harenae]MDQ0111864.1 transcriptional regulator with XRE-family HTH domain [Paenibacillus harenae]